MNEAAVAKAVAEWAEEHVTELRASYPFIVTRKTLLPDVMVDVTEKRIARGVDESGQFPTGQIQQDLLRIFEVAMYFMVEAGSDADADEKETADLRAFAERIESAWLADETLGARVAEASPVGLNFDYNQPFIEYQDGTRGRQMVVRGTIAELTKQGA